MRIIKVSNDIQSIRNWVTNATVGNEIGLGSAYNGENLKMLSEVLETDVNVQLSGELAGLEDAFDLPNVYKSFNGSIFILLVYGEEAVMKLKRIK